jgi:BirA family biotin operon repressor/biotin-[acetyl-CoA-carboxylase] ligase
MIDAEALLTRNDAVGSVVMASHQSAGQGRFSTRRWEAAPGESLLFTLIIPPDLAAPGRNGTPVALILALGIGNWLASIGLPASWIKWPNDILIGARKLAGILVTGARGHYLAGIGINLGQTAFTQDLRRPATSLLLEGLPADALDCLPAVLYHLRAAFDRPDWHSACQARLWRFGQTVEMTLPDGATLAGTISGLAPDGALLLDTAHGLQRILSGE